MSIKIKYMNHSILSCPFQATPFQGFMRVSQRLPVYLNHRQHFNLLPTIQKHIKLHRNHEVPSTASNINATAMC